MTEKEKHYCSLWAMPLPSSYPQRPGILDSPKHRGGVYGCLVLANLYRRMYKTRGWHYQETQRQIITIRQIGEAGKPRHVLSCNELYHFPPLMWPLLDPYCVQIPRYRSTHKHPLQNCAKIQRSRYFHYLIQRLKVLSPLTQQDFFFKFQMSETTLTIDKGNNELYPEKWAIFSDCFYTMLFVNHCPGHLTSILL